MRAFGELVGVSTTLVHYWTKGKRKPTPAMARRITAKTGIPLYKIRPDIWPQRGPQ
jgi:DNA-binding transcriptional regulator YdaS (Cro superfamily)